MTALSLLLTLGVALTLWLAVKRKWKALLWTLFSFVLIFIAAWYLFLHFASQAFKEHCQDDKTWRIEQYVIIKKRCLGFAGPPYYPVFLYKEGVEIDHILYMEDSTCIVKFKPNADDTLTFDICDMRMRKQED
jgi:hypothetical protein